MRSREEKALRDARARAAAAGWSNVSVAMRLREEVIAAEIAVAQARHEPWAEELDLGVWDTGAPLPHVVSGRSHAILICRARDNDPAWDGSYVRVVSPSDAEPVPLLVITFERCTSVRFGFPNDDVLHGLRIPGVRGYSAHRIHHSRWIAELDRIESVHRTPEPIAGTHYLLAFHDEIFEAVAQDAKVERVTATMGDALRDAAARLAG